MYLSTIISFSNGRKTSVYLFPLPTIIKKIGTVDKVIFFTSPIYNIDLKL